jgi:hypothetical protein
VERRKKKPRWSGGALKRKASGLGLGDLPSVRHNNASVEIFVPQSSAKNSLLAQRNVGNPTLRTTFLAVIDYRHFGGPDCKGPTFETQEASLSEKISFSDASGTSIQGNYELAGGVITVTAADGLSKTADVDGSMLSPETLAKMLLLQLHQQADVDPQISRHDQ